MSARLNLARNNTVYLSYKQPSKIIKGRKTLKRFSMQPSQLYSTVKTPLEDVA